MQFKWVTDTDVFLILVTTRRVVRAEVCATVMWRPSIEGRSSS